MNKITIKDWWDKAPAWLQFAYQNDNLVCHTVKQAILVENLQTIEEINFEILRVLMDYRVETIYRAPFKTPTQPFRDGEDPGGNSRRYY